MSKRLSDRALIWRALNEAFENVDGLIDAHSHMKDSPVVAQAEDFLRQVDDYAMRKYGRTISEARGRISETAGPSIQVFPASKISPSKFDPSK